MFKVGDEVSTSLYEYDVKGVIENVETIWSGGGDVPIYRVKLTPKFRMLYSVLRFDSELQHINNTKQLKLIV